MAVARSSANKAKIARRVVEVLDYFDDDHREATVMDIVRRYNRPQSSTSELLSSLVELGLLFKDPYSRSYTLAPRAGLIGTGGQPSLIREGCLVRLLDRIAAQTGLSVAVFGSVGLNVQVVSWRPGPRCAPAMRTALYGGLQDTLAASAAGWLLLSTVAQPRRDGIVRRLVAEATSDQVISPSELREQLDGCRERGFAAGPVGFASSAQTIAIILPGEFDQHPLAVGVVFGDESIVEPDVVLNCLNNAVADTNRQEIAPERIGPLLTAA